jgi:hypothetical protein
VLRNPDDNAHVAAASATIGDVLGADHYSSREDEKALAPDAKEGSKTPSSLTAWLNEQQEKAPAGPVPAPLAPPAPRARMTVMLGPQVTQVEIPGEGELPVNQPQAGSATPGAAEPVPPLDDSGAPPADSGSQPEDVEEPSSPNEPQ